MLEHTMDHRTYYPQFAHLLLRFGLAFRPGQKLLLEIPGEASELAECIAAAAEDAGASQVHVVYTDDMVDAMQLLADSSRFEQEIRLRKQALSEALSGDAVSLAFLSPVPALNSILNQRQKAAFFSYKNELRNVVRQAIRSRRIHWCYACCPNAGWAKTLFPDRPEEEALSLLWERTIEFYFLDREDPLDAWLSYYDRLYRRTRQLNSLSLEKLHFYNDAGTDLTVGLNSRCIWEGGLDRSQYDGTYYQCNLPSFEICTTTDRSRTNGRVSSSRPLFANGGLIDNFSLEFRDGKVVNVQAAAGEELLKGILARDEGSSYLGEVAFVEKDTPIAKSGLVFLNTLLDENAACHLALGSGFPGNIRGIDPADDRQLQEAGVNQSCQHVDFMFGTEDLCADGYCQNGEVLALFRQGKFAEGPVSDSFLPSFTKEFTES